MEIGIQSIAENLLSDEPLKLAIEVSRFKDLYAARDPASAAPNVLCRFVQELAIYSQGAVVRSLVKAVLVSQEEPSDKYDVRQGQDAAALFSARILVHLAASRVVGNFCIRDERSAWGLLDHFVENLECLRDPNREKAQWRPSERRPGDLGMELWAAFFSTAGMVYFARASKLFRESMRTCDELLSVLEFCLSEDTLRTCGDITSMRRRLSNIIEALSLTVDSQQWIIKQGFLKLVVRIYETAHLATEKDPQEVCSMSVFRLSESSECLKLMRQRDVHSMLKPHAKMIERHYGIWPVLEDRLLGVVSVPLKASQTGLNDNWRHIQLDMYASGLPIVCSWRGCSVPAENVSGTKFSKCSRCQVAHYCR